MEGSRLVYGCASEKMLAGEDVSDLLDCVLDSGISSFDTAENYGKSEEVLGNWIRKRKNRDRICLITKGCHPYSKDRVTPEDLKADLEQSLRRLHTDHIDIYMLHRDDRKVPVGPIVEVLDEYRKKGVIGRYGGSNWTVERIREANRYAALHGLAPFTVSSPHYALAVQKEDPYGGSDGCVNLSGPGMEAERAFYEESGMPVYAYSSLGRGFFSGRVKSGEPEKAAEVLDRFAVKGYCHPENFERLKRAEQLAEEKHVSVSQIALAWLFCRKMNVYPIVSSSDPERIRQNLKAQEMKLTDEEAAWLDLQN